MVERSRDQCRSKQMSSVIEMLKDWRNDVARILFREKHTDIEG